MELEIFPIGVVLTPDRSHLPGQSTGKKTVQFSSTWIDKSVRYFPCKPEHGLPSGAVGGDDKRRVEVLHSRNCGRNPRLEFRPGQVKSPQNYVYWESLQGQFPGVQQIVDNA